MMPIASHTQVVVPTQVSLVATPMPGTTVLRVLPDAVVPSLPDASLGPDYKGTGGYAGTASAPAPAPASPSGFLSVLIPSHFSTSSASLSASAMFATQLLSQGAQGGGEGYLIEYEALVAASQVKYKPSDATMPQPPSGGLFAKLLAETQNQNTRISVQLQQAPKEAVAQAAPQAAALPKPSPVLVKERAGNTQAAVLSGVRYAAHAYQATSVRNEALQREAEIEKVDEISG